MIDEKIRKYLKAVARGMISERLDIDSNEPNMPKGAPAAVLNERRGVFVTLELDGRLRGCIGDTSGTLPLILGIRENSVSAAFKDPRFDPLTASEFHDVEIEVSVLSVPVPLEYSGSSDLLEKLRVGDGVVLSSGFAKATYLPQVWGDLRAELDDGISKEGLKRKFLDSLCSKAGLVPDEWEKGLVEIETYRAEVF
ncbi:AmmeMemoRadiSam system protein A [Candidatus Peregrinibacteria bacterium]|jgi:uncharacterized protein|nr:AmmeMemoRadiSam system protein A [Candidatus Peregrinibacteria bacterium]MBT4147841.1 AmmeMemoRadiSam system protein A [Candidatus Peregrinibacteria bacterium]MBT4366182.1 AmmeMemoRadiSam system protein A [Candidatus Peregrinibacteria bacterium]MBT4455587.1 AmmeMemoRadiSam system protein A [Candidatus Peregrinibacteria bacterium]